MVLLRIIIFLFLWLISSNCYSATYYVSTTGDNGNSGTIGSPWKDISYATCGGTYACPVVTANANHVTAGDTLYIRGGTYLERDIIFAHTGTLGNLITVTAYPGETVLIDGNIFSLGEGVDSEFQTWCIDASARHPIFNIDTVNYIKVSGLSMKNGCKAGVLIGYDHATGNIIIENNEIYYTYEKDNTASVYLNNNFTSGVIVKNNKLHDNINRTGQSRGAGVEIFTGSNDVLVENNEIYNVLIGLHYKHGVAGSSAVPIFRNNVIHDLTQGGKTGQCGIRTSTDNLIITNNLLYDITTDGRAAIEIYHEDALCDKVGSFNNTITRNTIVDATKGISLNRPGSCTDNGARNTIVKDNLIYNNSSTNYRIWEGATSGAHATISDYNLIYDSSWTLKLYNTAYTSLVTWQALTGFPDGSHSPDANSITTQPTFVDYAGKNFTLAAGSAGKNAASDGTDMGANIALVGTGYIPSISIGTGTPNATVGSGSGNWTLQ